jgi:hypothetical protein
MRTGDLLEKGETGTGDFDGVGTAEMMGGEKGRYSQYYQLEMGYLV